MPLPYFRWAQKAKKQAKTLSLCAILALGCVWAQAQSALPQSQSALPTNVINALKRAGISEKDVSIVVTEAAPNGRSWLIHNEQTMMPPASVIKLVTTYAALDILGPSYTWPTAVFASGKVKNGILQGSLYIRGSGDPSMTADRLRDLLTQVKAAGITVIEGDLIIDRSVYAIPDVDPGQFDGEALRTYNVRPDALLVNYKSIELTFNPSMAAVGDQIPVLSNPPLIGVQIYGSVPVGNQRNCGDWKSALQADFSDPLHIRFHGSFPAVCGPKRWYVAYAEPQAYALRVAAGIWQQLGGEVKGKVTIGTVPAGAVLVAVGDSKPLAEVVRDVNKFSNNVMAQSVFLALSLPDTKTLVASQPVATPASYEASRKVLAAWWRQNLSRVTPPVMDNGSGLSRTESISAISLANMLQRAWAGPVMPEFIGSLPIAGVDGTMRRSRAQASAHIKTGSISSVTTRAGYVLGQNGQRLVLVFMVNNPKAAEAKEAFDALIDWASTL